MRKSRTEVLNKGIPKNTLSQTEQYICRGALRAPLMWGYFKTWKSLSVRWREAIAQRARRDYNY